MLRRGRYDAAGTANRQGGECKPLDGAMGRLIAQRENAITDGADSTIRFNRIASKSGP